MLQLLAQPFEGRSPVRGVLLIVGVVCTVALTPLALIGLFVAVSGFLFGSAADEIEMAFSVALLFFGGLFGMAAAWCRILILNDLYRRSGRLFYSTIAGLVIGIATAILVFRRFGTTIPELPFWIASAVVLLVVLLGVALLGATVGARMRPNNALLTDANSSSLRTQRGAENANLSGPDGRRSAFPMWSLPGALMWIPTTLNILIAAYVLELGWERAIGVPNTAQGEMGPFLVILGVSAPIAVLVFLGWLVLFVIRLRVPRDPQAPRQPGLTALAIGNVVAPLLLFVLLGLVR